MDRADLELLVAIDEEGSLTAAASRLHTAQPALSRRLARIESETTTLLFDRGRKGAAATPTGRVVLEAARHALGAIGQVESASRRAARAESGTLRVGTTPTLGADLLPPALAAFRASHPGVRLELVASGDSRALRQAVLGHELDIAASVVPEQLEAGLVCEPGGRQEFSIVVASDDELADESPVPRERLRGRPVVALPRGEGLRGLLEAVYRELGTSPVIAIETSERGMLIPFVTAGLGFTIVPSMFARTRAGKGTVVLPLDPPVQRDVGLVRRSSQTTDPLIEAFVGLVDFQ